MITRVRAPSHPSGKPMEGLTLFYRARFRRRVLQHVRLFVSSLVAHVSYLPLVTSLKSNHSPPSSVIFPQVQQPRYVISARCHWLELMLMYLCRVLIGNISTACINFFMSTYTKTFCGCPNLLMLTVIAALTTLFFQRRDQRRAETSEISTLGDVTDHDGYGSIQRIDSGGQGSLRWGSSSSSNRSLLLPQDRLVDL